MVLALLLSLTASQTARAEVIDRVVAIVEEQLITASDVSLEAELSRIDPSPVPFWSRNHADPLHRLIDAAVIREIARDVALYKPSDEQIGARLAAMRERLADRDSWHVFLSGRGLDEEALRAVMERRMVVEAYLLRNIAVSSTDESHFIEVVDATLAPWEDRLRIREVAP